MQTEFAHALTRLKSDFQGNTSPAALRAELQNYFDTLQRAEQSALQKQPLLTARVGGLRLLRALQNRTPPQGDAPLFSVPLSALCESAVFCADLLCGHLEKRVFFTGTDNIFVPARPHPLLWTVLNLLSNALMHSAGRYIFVQAEEFSNRAVISVISEGDFPVSLFFKSQTCKGNGLWFANRTACLHNGALYLCCSKDYTAVKLSLPFVSADVSPWKVPDFTDWLADSLSPIYVCLCDSIFSTLNR